jgi:hypothetical protein
VKEMMQKIAFEGYEGYEVQYFRDDDGDYWASLFLPEPDYHRFDRLVSVDGDSFEDLQRRAIARIDEHLANTPTLASQLAAANERIKELENTVADLTEQRDSLRERLIPARCDA